MISYSFFSAVSGAASSFFSSGLVSVEGAADLTRKNRIRPNPKEVNVTDGAVGFIGLFEFLLEGFKVFLADESTAELLDGRGEIRAVVAGPDPGLVVALHSVKLAQVFARNFLMLAIRNQ